MKRKRGARRKPPNKSPATFANAGPANSGFLNDENNSDFDRDNGIDSRMKSGSAQVGNNTSHHLEERFLGEVDAGNSIQTGNLMTNVASFAAKLSRAVGSPNAEPTNNSPAVHDDIMQEVEPELSESDHLNNEKELNEALSVIRKIMKMESAKPFNLPVDPTALGIPDYLEIIEKPMDFGTVCNNIEWGGKYRNSKDVYTDVQLIWNNCARYNKKGDYILDLMRRVKTNFEKLWNAAGLFSEELEVEDANLKNAAEHPTKTSKDGNAFPSGSVISKSIQQEKRQDFTGLRQMQAQKYLPIFSHTQSQHLSPDHQGERQSLECQPLHPLRNGHLPTTESTVGDKLHTYTCRGGHNNVTNNNQQQDENRPAKELSHQPSACHASKSHPNERPYKYSQQQDDNRPWREPSHQPSASHGSRIHLNERPYTYSQQQVENRPRKELSHQPSASHGSRIHLNERPYTTYIQQQNENRPRKELSHQPSASHASKFYPNERPYEYQPRSSNHHYTSNSAAANTHSAGHSTAELRSVANEIARLTEEYRALQGEEVQNIEVRLQNFQTQPSHATVENQPSNATIKCSHQVQNIVSDIQGYDPLGPELEKTRTQSSENFQTSNSEENSSHPTVTDTLDKKKRKRAAAFAKTRGVNQCTRVCNLREGQKLQVEFFNNGPVGENQKEMVRHMGKLVRDRNIVPVRVHSWEDLNASVMEHLWQSLIKKFGCEDMDLRRDALIDHMKRLWQNWRGLMKRDNINKKETIEDAIKDVPNHLTKEDWEWLLKEHYMSDAFKKLSERNSDNRGTKRMMHRTGSKPIKEVIWSELGAKDGNYPLISEVFRRTRVRKSGTLDEEETSKYEDILEVEKDEGISRFDVIQKCFGRQEHSHIVCFGYGTKPKDVRVPLVSREELTRNLHDKKRETSMLKKRLDDMEEERKRERDCYDEKVKNLEKLMMEKNAQMEQKLQTLMTMALAQQNTNL